MATVAPRDPVQLQIRALAMRLPATLARFQVQLQADGRSPHIVAQYARHVSRFAVWLDVEHRPDDVAALEPEHVALFLASAETLRRPHGRTKRVGALKALRSSLRGFFEFAERAGSVVRSPATSDGTSDDEGGDDVATAQVRRSKHRRDAPSHPGALRVRSRDRRPARGVGLNRVEQIGPLVTARPG